MKTLNVKVPITLGKILSDSGRLNPEWFTSFISEYIDREVTIKPDQTEFTFNYTFKIEDSLHKKLKLKAIEGDIPMNEYSGRLLLEYSSNAIYGKNPIKIELHSKYGKYGDKDNE